MKQYRRGILPLSGDPLTWGHLDIIKRAGEQCDYLVLAILHNPAKIGSCVFDEQERIKHVERVIKDFCPCVEAVVLSSEESMTDMLLRENCDVVFRGARDEHDRRYEEQQLVYHEMVFPGMRNRTVILEADPNLKHVQSTVARNFAVQHLDATGLVPMFIQARLWRRIHKQKVIGVTGIPGVGKTTLIKATIQAVRENKLPAHHVVLNDLMETLLAEDSPGAKALKMRLDAHSESLFPELPEDLRTLLFAHLSRHYRQALKGRSGIVFVEGSYLAEDDLLHWVNNNIVVVTRSSFSSSDGSTRTTGETWDSDRKLAFCKENAERDKYGLVFSFKHEKNNFSKGLGGIIVAKTRNGEL